MLSRRSHPNRSRYRRVPAQDKRRGIGTLSLEENPERVPALLERLLRAHSVRVHRGIAVEFAISRVRIVALGVSARADALPQGGFVTMTRRASGSIFDGNLKVSQLFLKISTMPETLAVSAP